MESDKGKGAEPPRPDEEKGSGAAGRDGTATTASVPRGCMRGSKEEEKQGGGGGGGARRAGGAAASSSSAARGRIDDATEEEEAQPQSQENQGGGGGGGGGARRAGAEASSFENRDCKRQRISGSNDKMPYKQEKTYLREAIHAYMQGEPLMLSDNATFRQIAVRIQSIRGTEFNLSGKGEAVLRRVLPEGTDFGRGIIGMYRAALNFFQQNEQNQQ